MIKNAGLSVYKLIRQIFAGHTHIHTDTHTKYNIEYDIYQGRVVRSWVKVTQG